MRLKTRVTLAVTAVTAVTLSASFVAVSLLVARDETRDLDQALLAQASIAAELALLHNADRPVATEGSAEVPERLDPTTRYMATYDADGSLISSSRNFGGAPPTRSDLVESPPPKEGTAVNLSSGGVGLRGVVVPMGSRGQTLLYAASRRTVDDDLWFISRVVSVIFVAAMLLTSLVARWLSGRLSSDVQAIAGVARDVAQGDLAARVGVGARGSAETRMLAADMDHMIGQLGALVTAQRTFISHAAHELRSPLATIRGELQLALRRPREAAEYRGAIEEVLTDVESLAVLAEDLLTLARVQAGSPSPGPGGGLAPAAMPLGEAVAEALRMARGAADERGVALVEASADRGWSDLCVRGARGEIARALRNLVDNAVAHSPAGGRVEVRIERSGSRAVIAVTDEGPGVAPEDRRSIFEPFYRGSKDQGGDRPGAGLGLTIARGIARAHGGDVALDEGHEAGSRFLLELPIEG